MAPSAKMISLCHFGNLAGYIMHTPQLILGPISRGAGMPWTAGPARAAGR